VDGGGEGQRTWVSRVGYPEFLNLQLRQDVWALKGVSSWAPISPEELHFLLDKSLKERGVRLSTWLGVPWPQTLSATKATGGVSSIFSDGNSRSLTGSNFCQKLVKVTSEPKDLVFSSFSACVRGVFVNSTQQVLLWAHTQVSCSRGTGNPSSGLLGPGDLNQELWPLSWHPSLYPGLLPLCRAWTCVSGWKGIYAAWFGSDSVLMRQQGHTQQGWKWGWKSVLPSEARARPFSKVHLLDGSGTCSPGLEGSLVMSSRALQIPSHSFQTQVSAIPPSGSGALYCTWSAKIEKDQWFLQANQFCSSCFLVTGTAFPSDFSNP
jgi:hypothetical protein